MRDLKISDKKKNVTDKDKGGQKCNLTTETSYKMWQVRKQVREQLWKVRELVRKHKPKSSGTSSEKTKKVRKQQDLVRRKPYKVRRKVSNNHKNMLVFPL